MTLRRKLVSFALVATACNGEFRFDDLVPDAGTGNEPGGADSGADSEAGGARGACVNDENCAGFGLRCDPSSGSCVVCIEDVDCSSAMPRCDTALHRCVECGSSSDCGDAGRCETTTRRCVASCSAANKTCPSGLECESDDNVFFCRQCEHDDTCQEKRPQTPHCDPKLFVCVSCTNDAHCPASTPSCDRTRGSCVECMRSDQCPALRPVCSAQGICLGP